jgi:hypothetical protein
MKRFVQFIALLILINSPFLNFGNGLIDSTKSIKLSISAFDALNIPALDIPINKEIVIAVLDDGFRLSHNSLRGFVYNNQNEIPGNQKDDDSNSFIDDYHGWDVSDNDNEVSTTKSLETEYFHGTFIASLITRIVSDCFGEKAVDKIKILPVKVLSDQASTTAIRDGYLGVKYAMEMGADIICCAWSGGTPNAEEKEIINQALQKNILIIGSAGNFYQEKIEFPASINGICAVAALDTSLKKKESSNYGMRIDLAFPGEKVKAAYSTADNAWFYGNGTSAAAGLATGCAAVLKAISPQANPQDIMEALKNTAYPLDSINVSYCGKLGAGLPNLSKAANYLLNPDRRFSFFNSSRSEGTIYIANKNNHISWDIKPYGAFQSVHIIPDKINKKDLNKKICIYQQDSLFFEGALSKLKGGFKIPGSEISLQFASNKKRDIPSNLKINYFVETIDSSLLYCKDIQYINAEEGIISDNSGNKDYANMSACKWIITAENSNQIFFSFSDFNTEAKVDFVWLFDGTAAIQNNIIAKFSGSEIPPSITSRTNQVLIWFVTDKKNTSQGWTVHFEGK